MNLQVKSVFEEVPSVTEPGRSVRGFRGNKAIAHQCPYSGGQAVYFARNYVMMFTDTIEYQDDIICLTQGIYREAELKNVTPGFNLIPNPASKEVQVELINVTEGICRVEIRNALGARVLQHSFNCSDIRSNININILAPGVYTVSVKVNEKVDLVKKLIIVR